MNDSATDNTFSALPSGESSFTYNAIGQMVSRTEGGVTEYYNYTPYALVEGVYTDAALTNPKVRYAYDESGFRYWKKEYTTADKTETFHIRDASGNILATYEKKGAASIAQTELPVYGSGRIGVLTRGDMSTTYELSDHLGNVRALFGKDASSTVRMVGYTDYYPYGMVMPNRQYTLGSRYRFGYQGQFAEKDEETGLDHFEARDYDSRLGRWLVNDPAWQHWSPYLAMGNNPVSGVDPDGRTSITDGYTDGYGNYVWLDGITTSDPFILNGSLLTKWTNDRSLFNLWSGGGDSFTVLPEVKIVGKMSDHYRTMSNPIVQDMHKLTGKWGRAIGMTMAYSMAAYMAPTGFTAEFANQMAFSRGDVSKAINNMNIVDVFDKTGLVSSFVNVSGNGYQVNNIRQGLVNYVCDRFFNFFGKKIGSVLENNAPKLMINVNEFGSEFTGNLFGQGINTKLDIKYK